MLKDYKVPLSKEDAEVITHAVEVRILTASQFNATLDDTSNYGEGLRWLRQLLQGESVTIPDHVLEKSREIMTRVYR